MTQILKQIIKACSLFALTCFLVTSFANVKSMQNQTKNELNQIAQAYEKAYFDQFPELGMYWGRVDTALDRFMDHSISSQIAWQKKEDAFLLSLKKLNVDELRLHSSGQYHTYQLLRETLENNIAARICKDELWNVNPLWGWHNILAMVAEKQPVGTVENRALALKRWRTVDTVVNDELNNLKLGLKEGYSAPKPVVQRVLKQLLIILNTPIEQSPFFEFAKRDGDAAFKKEVSALIENEINPAIKRYADFLENEYLPAARDKVGVSALPHGELCYQAKVKRETTLSIKASDIHQFGLEHMLQLNREVAEIGQRNFDTQDMSQVFRLAKKQSSNYFHSEQDILHYNEAALERAIAKAPQWFDMMPKAKGILKPYPQHRAQTGAPGEYHPPSDDGSRPGIFYINTYQPEAKSRIDQESTLFHELIPGHHFQVALAHENKASHSLDKYLWNSGYGEGWALYVERLADEMELYQDDISRLGMLSNEALRTARLVVDPGLHVMNWSRQQAIDYLKQHTAMDDNIIESEVDRYIMMPGQATSYMLGKREIENLRNLSKQRQGNAFDIRQYHNQVLKNGTVTLPMLRTQIENWLAETNHS
jgi:uncharacterized protein (DUF885 family)